MIADKIKVKVSKFVADIIDNDALAFNFTKNGISNKNALLNKLIPTLVEVRKARRSEIERVLKEEYNRQDAENIYNAVNTVIDKVYFNDEELHILDEYIWIRPNKNSMPYFDEIENIETTITAQEISTYIRGLLNEYSRLPQYKRESLVFDKELDLMSDACYYHQIMYYRDKLTNVRDKVFVFTYLYGYKLVQTNYIVVYNINKKEINAIPLSIMKDIVLIKQKFKPSEKLINALQIYCDNEKFDNSMKFEEV